MAMTRAFHMTIGFAIALALAWMPACEAPMPKAHHVIVQAVTIDVAQAKPTACPA